MPKAAGVDIGHEVEKIGEEEEKEEVFGLQRARTQETTVSVSKLSLNEDQMKRKTKMAAVTNKFKQI